VAKVRDAFFDAARIKGAAQSATIPVMYVSSASMTKPVRQRLGKFLRLIPGYQTVLQRVSRPEGSIEITRFPKAAGAIRHAAKEIAEYVNCDNFKLGYSWSFCLFFLMLSPFLFNFVHAWVTRPLPLFFKTRLLHSVLVAYLSLAVQSSDQITYCF
jgi:hypothetical protein